MKHRDRTDPDALANFLDGVPWRPMGWTLAGFAALPASLVFLTTGWTWWLR